MRFTLYFYREKPFALLCLFYYTHSMDQSLYIYSLFLSLPLMLFFGFHMLFARTPDKQIFANFLLSRRLMGSALLILAANYSVHLFFTIRVQDLRGTILMNLSTYFLCYWLFSSAMMTLLNNHYITRKRFLGHIARWVVYSLLAILVSLYDEAVTFQLYAILILAAWLLLYGLVSAIRLLRTYKKAIRMFENTHSDDIGAYIRWLSIFTYWAICFGLSCSLLTFLPSKYVFIWILSSIPFYIYLYCCYQNYLLFHEQVEQALMEDAVISEEKEVLQSDMKGEDVPGVHSEVERRLKDWVDCEGYRSPGITLNDLALQLATNRTYLSEYISSVYQLSFRNWISYLRVEYAKRVIRQQPQLKIRELSEQSGFLSVSHFIRIFNEKEGCSPTRWRKQNMLSN